MALKNIYHIRKVVWVTLHLPGAETMNLGWGDSDFIVQKGAFSILEFVVRDIDRKPVNLNGKRPVIKIIQHSTNEMILSRELQITDSARGRCQLTLNPADTINLMTGTLRYSLVMENIDTGQYQYLYNDFNQEVVGHIDLKDDIIQCPPKTFEVNAWTPVEAIPHNVYNSGLIPGLLQKGYTNSTTTIAIYGKEFTGKFFIEATLDVEANQATISWFKLNLIPGKDFIEYEDFSGIDAYNFNNEYNWLRVGYIQESWETGELPKILIN